MQPRNYDEQIEEDVTIRPLNEQVFTELGWTAVEKEIEVTIGRPFETMVWTDPESKREYLDLELPDVGGSLDAWHKWVYNETRAVIVKLNTRDGNVDIIGSEMELKQVVGNAMLDENPAGILSKWFLDLRQQLKK